MKQSIYLLVLVFSLCIGTAYGQGTVSGHIIDADGEPLIGASVVEDGNEANGTITNFEGYYELEVPEDATILISYIGFADQKIAVDGRSSIDLALQKGEQLDEVVVTALGISREKKALGFAVDEIGEQDIENSGEDNVLSALQGRSAGLQVFNTSGSPGAGTTILLRTVNSIDPGRNNAPLIVIDGMEISNDVNVGRNTPGAANFGTGSNSATQTSTGNRLMDINPQDIANVSILKGAAASALYGVRAANGAIIITTKKGARGEPEVNVHYGTGWSKVNMFPDVQTDFIDGNRSGSNKRSFLWDSWGSAVTPQTISQPHNVYEAFYGTGRRHNVGASVNAGDENLNYRVSANYLNSTGVVPHSFYNKGNVGLSFNNKFSDKFSAGANFMYSQSNANTPHEGRKSIMNVLSYMVNIADMENYTEPYTYGGNAFAGIIDHPLFLAENVTNNSTVNRTIAGINAKYSFLENLSLNYNFGIDYYSDRRLRTVHSETDEGQSGVNGGPPYGFVADNRFNNTSITSNLFARWNTELNSDLGLSLLLGNYIYSRENDYQGLVGTQFQMDEFFNESNTIDLEQYNSLSRYRNYAFYGEATLDYKDYVYLTLTGRNDFSSTLPEANNSYFFPSFNLSWIVSDMLGITGGLSYLKLRASYAIAGKDAAPYRLGRYYGLASGFPFGETLGYAGSTLIGDENLRPEFSKTLEFGVEANFADNRAGVDLTYFNTNLEDMILSVPIPNSTGAARLVTNAGSMFSHGIEASAFVDLIPSTHRDEFGWRLSANYSWNRARIKEINTDSDNNEIILASIRNVTNKYVVGGRPGDLYGNPFNRTEDGELILDETGLPTLNLDTTVLMGNANPDFILGFSNSFTFKGFSLSVLAEWKKGGYALDVGRAHAIGNGQLKETLGRYQNVKFAGVQVDADGNYVTNETYAEIQPAGFYRNSSRYRYAPEAYLKRTDWFRLRNVSLSYSLGEEQLRMGGIDRIKLSLIANNLYLSTPYRGFDPESNYYGAGSNIGGFVGYRTPNTKSYEFRINLTF